MDRHKPLTLDSWVLTTPAVGPPFITGSAGHRGVAGATLTEDGSKIYVVLEEPIEIESLWRFLAYVKQELTPLHGVNLADHVNKNRARDDL